MPSKAGGKQQLGRGRERKKGVKQGLRVAAEKMLYSVNNPTRSQLLLRLPKEMAHTHTPALRSGR